MGTYESVRERAERVIKDNWTKEYIRDFVKVIPLLPAVSTVLMPDTHEAAVTEAEQVQSSGEKGSVIAASWGAAVASGQPG